MDNIPNFNHDLGVYSFLQISDVMENFYFPIWN